VQSVVGFRPPRVPRRLGEEVARNASRFRLIAQDDSERESLAGFLDGRHLSDPCRQFGTALVEFVRREGLGLRGRDVGLTDPKTGRWPHAVVQLRKEDEAGTAYNAGKFPFTANGRARTMGEASGFVKFIADAKTDEILGCHMIGPNVSELLAEVVLAMEFRGTTEDIAMTCHSHPTLSEATKEAALNALGRNIHA